MRERWRVELRQECRVNPTGKVQFIHVTSRVTMMQALVTGTKGSFKSGDKHPRHKRGQVKGRSRAATRRLLWTVAAYSPAFAGEAWFGSFTFGKWTPSWEEAKATFHKFRVQLGKNQAHVAGLWVVEAQKMGQPHFHILFTRMGETAAWDVVRRWVNLVEHTHPVREHLEDHAVKMDKYEDNRTDAAVELYLAKVMVRELTKRAQQDDSAHTGRTWGYLNKPRLTDHFVGADLMEIDREHVARWLRDRTLAGIAADKSYRGAVCMDADGELYNLCYASTADFSAKAREFLNEAQASGPRQSRIA